MKELALALAIIRDILLVLVLASALYFGITAMNALRGIQEDTGTFSPHEPQTGCGNGAVYDDRGVRCS